MTERVIQTSKRLAAMRQIHAAIGHFHAGDFECAITLCSAAEGQMPEPDEPSRHLFGRLKRAGAKSDNFNFVATWMKHGWGRDEVEIHRQRYYEWLQATRDTGDWEGWLAFFLQGVAEVSAQATETARRILALREAHRASIAAKLGYAAGNGHRVLEHLFGCPIMSVNEVRDLIGTTYPAANQLVDRLVTLGILEEITGQARNRRFRYAPYIRLFNDREGEQ